MDDAHILNLAQARQLLGVSEKTLRNYCKGGKLAFQQERNLRGVLEYRFRKADVLALLDLRTRHQGHSAAPTPPPPKQAPPPVLKQPAPDSPAEPEAKRPTAPAPRKPVPAPPLPVEPVPSSAATPPERDYAALLIEQLQRESEFLKEQVQEKDRQLAAKDRQLERQLERINNLNETLAELARSLIKPE